MNSIFSCNGPAAGSFRQEIKPYLRTALAAAVNLLYLAKHHYYRGTPIMTDFEYDTLENWLKKIDPTNPVLEVVGDPWMDCEHLCALSEEEAHKI